MRQCTLNRAILLRPSERKKCLPLIESLYSPEKLNEHMRTERKNAAVRTKCSFTSFFLTLLSANAFFSKLSSLSRHSDQTASVSVRAHAHTPCLSKAAELAALGFLSKRSLLLSRFLSFGICIRCVWEEQKPGRAREKDRQREGEGM